MAQRAKDIQKSAPSVKPVKKEVAEPVKTVNADNDKIKKQLQKQLDEIEAHIENLKAQKQTLELQISDGTNQERIGTLSEQYSVLEKSIESKNQEFETIFEQLLSL